MREKVDISYEFSSRCPVVYPEEAQKALLVFEEEIYCSADDTAPEDLEHESMPYQATHPIACHRYDHTHSALGVYPLLTYKTDLGGAQFRKYFTKQQSAISFREFWLIPAKILLRLESADLSFMTLVGGKVSGGGKKTYHHIDPIAEPLGVPTHGRVYLLDDDEDNQDEHGTGSRLGRLDLGD